MEEIRLQAYIAQAGICSRRKAEELIARGVVKVNGKRVTEMGVKVSDGDVVEVEGKPVAPTKKKIYIALNKPVGYITAVEDDRGRKTVMDLVDNEITDKIFPVGRLDYDTHGLLIMTNDGVFANNLIHPSRKIEKVYIAQLNKEHNEHSLRQITKGIEIEGRKCKPVSVRALSPEAVELVIMEGKNREVRRMFEAVGYEVEDLCRVAVGNIKLGHIPHGRWRHLTKGEIMWVMKNESAR